MKTTVQLTLCEKEIDVLNKDIPTLIYKDVPYDSDLSFIYKDFDEWINSRDFDKSVFVCFENYIGLPNEKLRDEQKTIIVSHDKVDVSSFVGRVLNYGKFGLCQSIFDLAIFEFENYQEALDYCKDLRESF